jgi:AcrR family transcriptional regulator
MARRDPQLRRQAILEAGLAIFSSAGFAAAKLDAVAEKAGVAKGTIYLHFRDKQDLFEQIVRSTVVPVLARLEDVASRNELSTRAALAGLYQIFVTEVRGTRREQVLRLVISEGSRFPEIASFYYREVVSKGAALLRRVLRRGVANGELASDRLAEHPQLVFAPLIMIIVWEGLFRDIESLDVESMLQAFLDMLVPKKGLALP